MMRLIEAKRGLESDNLIDIGFGNLIKKLTGKNGQTFNVLALTFSIKRVKRKRALATAAQPRNHDNFVARYFNVNIF